MGFGGGAAFVAGGVADAATSVSNAQTGDETHSSSETPLTGTIATKVKAAALAKYPGATVDRVETDSDGVYEAHIVSKTGDNLVVQIDRTFRVTGTRTSSDHRGDDHEDHERGDLQSARSGTS
jgi:hypothetical protein